jgi:hypothetical protein
MQSLPNSDMNNEFFSLELNNDQLDLVSGGANKLVTLLGGTGETFVSTVTAAIITGLGTIIAAALNQVGPALNFQLLKTGHPAA